MINQAVAGSDKVESGSHAPRILCLDDCPLLLGFLATVLTRAGFEVWTVDDEAAAMCLLLFADRIDLFTQDLDRQEGAGGAQVLRWLKSHPKLRHIPVLIISGFPWIVGDAQVREQGLDSRRDLAGYLEKPFTVRQLVDMTHSAIAEGDSVVF